MASLSQASVSTWRRRRRSSHACYLLATQGSVLNAPIRADQIDALSLKSDTAAAILYALRLWPALLHYCEDGAG
jgi:hypothetical protein